MTSDTLRPYRCEADSLCVYFLRELHQTAVGVFVFKKKELIEIEVANCFKKTRKKVSDDEGTRSG